MSETREEMKVLSSFTSEHAKKSYRLQHQQQQQWQEEQNLQIQDILLKRGT